MCYSADGKVEAQMIVVRAIAIGLLAMTAPAQAAIVYQFSDKDFTRTIITANFIVPYVSEGPFLANFCETVVPNQSCDLYGGALVGFAGGDNSCLFDHRNCQYAYIYRVFYEGKFIPLYSVFSQVLLNHFGVSSIDGTTTLSVTSLPAVPEPTVWAMLISGFASAGAALRYGRYRKRA